MGSADGHEPRLGSPVKCLNSEDDEKSRHRENRHRDSRDEEVRDGERRDRPSRRKDRGEQSDRRGDDRYGRGRISTSDRGDGYGGGDGYGARDASDPRDRNRRERDWPERSGRRERDDHRGSTGRERSPRGRDDVERRGSFRREFDGDERPRGEERGRDERYEPRSNRWSPTREDRGSREHNQNDQMRNLRNDGGNERQGSPGLDRFGFILGEDGDEEGGAFNRGGGRGSGRGGDGGRGGGRGGGRREEGTDALPELYSIHKSTVRSVRPFGIFVAMDGYRKHGLIHLSHVSEYEVTSRDDNDVAKVAALSSVAGEGESVWVKVVSIKEEDTERPRIGVSMKLVNQRDGSDKDPNNLKLEEHQNRPQGGGRAKLEIGAVLNVTCTRCGGHGHLKTECFASGEKHYELLGEEEEGEKAGQGVGGAYRGVQGRALPPPPPLGDTRGLEVDGRARSAGAGVGVGKGFVLPEKVTSKEEALAVIAGLKLEKKKRKEAKEERRRERREKKEKKKEKKKKEKKREEKEKRGKKEKKEMKRKKEEKSDNESESESESDGSSEEEGGGKERETRDRKKGEERHEEREMRNEQNKSRRRE